MSNASRFGPLTHARTLVTLLTVATALIAWWTTREPVATLLAALVGLAVWSLAAFLVTRPGARQRRTTHDRGLAELTSRLLTSRDVVELGTAATEGVHRLVDDPQVGAAMWLVDGDTVELVAHVGPGEPPVRRLLIENAPRDIRARVQAGRPFRTDETTTKELAHVFGLDDGQASFLLLPLLTVDDAEPAGAVVLSSPGSLDHLADSRLEHVAYGMSLALDRVRLREALHQHRSQLGEVGDSKNEFVSTVSHELRTPLTAICGFAEVLESRWAHLTDQARIDLLRRIRRQAERQRRLVDDLLLVSRVMSGRLQTAPVTVDLAAAAHEAITNLELGGRTSVDIPSRLEVVVDADHLQQILDNLLSNAAKYGAPPYEVEATFAAGRAQLTVRDHGPGLPPALREVLFEPFRQGDGSDRRDGGGLGIGLTIARDLVALNRGTIRCVPPRDNGPGSAFEVSLPARRAGRPGLSAVDRARATESPAAPATREEQVDAR